MKVSPELLKACYQRDPSAVENLYRQTGPYLFGLCLRYSASYEDAEDLFHDLFLYLLDKVHTFRFEGSFQGWLTKVSIHFIIKRIKSKKNYPLNLTHNLTSTEEAHSNENIELPSSKSELVERIIEILYQMPEGYRTIFCLYVIDGYKHREIAQMLGISEGTSKSQLARAIQFIKKHLQNKVNHKIATYEPV